MSSLLYLDQLKWYSKAYLSKELVPNQNWSSDQLFSRNTDSKLPVLWLCIAGKKILIDSGKLECVYFGFLWWKEYHTIWLALLSSCPNILMNRLQLSSKSRNTFHWHRLDPKGKMAVCLTQADDFMPIN